jgi:hypothetical protein
LDIAITAAGGVDYEWNPEELGDIITLSPITDTEYIVSTADVWTCENSDTVNVNVFEVFADAGEDADTWVWTDGFDQQTNTVSTEGTIGVESSIGTCSNSDEIYITLSDPDVEFAQDTIYSDVAVTLDAGDGFAEYLWNDNSTEQTLDIVNSGWYYVTVTNEFGCMDNDSVYFDFVSDISISLTDIEFSIYPNPTNGVFVIEASNIFNVSIKLEIINSLGQIVESAETNNEIIEFDITDQKSGLYFVRVWVGAEVRNWRIIKQ